MRHDPMRLEVEHALRDGRTITLVYLNLAGFRKLNRQYGREHADVLLWMLGDRLVGAFGATAVLRLPGDEFLLALGMAGDRDRAACARQDVASLMAIPFDWPGGSVTLSAAIGTATSPHDGDSFERLLHQAEAAMLDAREARDAHCSHGGPCLQHGTAATGVAERFERALARGEFVLYYQPQVDLVSGDVIGAEALIRWNHPERGLLSPSEFIDEAEQSGAIVEIGRWTLREACREAARWRDGGCSAPIVAVNLSAHQFDSGKLAESVQEALHAAQLPSSCLELEFTETILIHDTAKVLTQIRQLKNMGLTLSLDDFGTGYSSLSYLKKFAVDKIKIDRSFVCGLCENPNDAAIVRAIVQIARSLGLRTIAEGVEDKSALGRLQLLGCDEVQGYHFSPPLSAAAFAKTLAVLRRHRTPQCMAG